MYYIDTDHPTPRPATTPEPTHDESEVTQECDFCGEPIRHETAVARPGGDGGEPVVLCTKCEFGVD
jgi:hypothetical protein